MNTLLLHDNRDIYDPASVGVLGDAVEYEFEVWQRDSLQAGGSATDLASVQAEADHYALMYGQDGPVEVRLYERRRIVVPTGAQP